MAGTLFMVGLFGIGVALLLGIGMRLAAVMAGDTFGFGRWWSELPLVKRYPVLR